MEKTLVKKNLHLTPQEKRHVAQMLDRGDSLKDVNRWHQMRFGKEISQSVFYRLKKNFKTILAETHDKKNYEQIHKKS